MSNKNDATLDLLKLEQNKTEMQILHDRKHMRSCPQSTGHILFNCNCGLEYTITKILQEFKIG